MDKSGSPKQPSGGPTSSHPVMKTGSNTGSAPPPQANTDGSRKPAEDLLVMVELADGHLNTSNTSAKRVGEIKGSSGQNWAIIPGDQQDLAKQVLQDPQLDKIISTQDSTRLALPFQREQVYVRRGSVEDIRTSLRRQAPSDSMNQEPTVSRGASTTSLEEMTERCNCFCVSMREVGAQFN